MYSFKAFCSNQRMRMQLSTPVFAASHLPLSTPGLVIRGRGSDMNSDSCQIFQLEDEDEFELQHHNLHCNQVMEFDLSKTIGASDANIWIKGSVDGLICLQDLASKPYDPLYIRNPITREYIALPGIETVVEYPHLSEYGFGQSKISCQYKVVRKVHRHSHDHQAGPCSGLQNYECLVYAVGTRSWRSIKPGPPFGHYLSSFSLFLNGNFHGFLHDYGESGDMLISCFNLEAESFRPFPPPPPPVGPVALGTLGILDDYSCFLDNSSEDEYIIVIWAMKEYGVGESWTTQFVISNSEEFVVSYFESVYPIKAFKDGDILLSWDNNNLFYFSSKTETCQKLQLVIQSEPGWIEVIPHCSTFLSLKSFTGEDVISFS